MPLPIEDFGKLELWRVQTDNGSIAILPAYVLVLVAAALATWWILNRTLMGRAIFAIGGNASIAERLGYDARKVQVFVFGYAGLLAGIAGMLHVASNRLANPFDLTGNELGVIAAVVLGGARITGGSGSVIGTILGVVLVDAGLQRPDPRRHSEYLADLRGRLLHHPCRHGFCDAAEFVKGPCRLEQVAFRRNRATCPKLLFCRVSKPESRFQFSWDTL